MPTKSIWDVLLPPKAGLLPSAAPGTGPYATDTKTTYKPGTVIPSPELPDRVGYGGGGDILVIEPQPRQQDFEQLQRDRARMRGHALGGPPSPVVPRYNALYDGLRTQTAFDTLVQNGAHGSLTPATGVQTLAVNLDNPPNLRTSQFPGAIQVYPVIISFSFAPVAITMTGAHSFLFQSAQGGYPIPLGEYNASSGSVENFSYIVDGPIADAGQLFMGNIIYTGTTIATAVTVNWRIAFGWAYLLPTPAFRGYDSDHAIDTGNLSTARTHHQER